MVRAPGPIALSERGSVGEFPGDGSDQMITQTLTLAMRIPRREELEPTSTTERSLHRLTAFISLRRARLGLS